MNMIDCFIRRFSWSSEPQRDPFFSQNEANGDLTKEERKLKGLDDWTSLNYCCRHLIPPIKSQIVVYNLLSVAKKVFELNKKPPIVLSCF
jgi:hypothetical protein